MPADNAVSSTNSTVTTAIAVPTNDGAPTVLDQIHERDANVDDKSADMISPPIAWLRAG